MILGKHIEDLQMKPSVKLVWYSVRDCKDVNEFHSPDRRLRTYCWRMYQSVQREMHDRFRS